MMEAAFAQGRLALIPRLPTLSNAGGIEFRQGLRFGRVAIGGDTVLRSAFRNVPLVFAEFVEKPGDRHARHCESVGTTDEFQVQPRTAEKQTAKGECPVDKKRD